MKLQKLLTFLFCFALLFVARSGWSQGDYPIDLAIKRGSPDAMLEAGKKGASDLIPLMRSHLNDRDDPNYSGEPGNWQPRQAAQMALAKLGDKIEQQKIGCELFYGNLAEQSTAFYKLEYVGGWFEIGRLAPFLPDSEENSKYMPEPGIADGDATIGPRQYLAVEALERMHLNKPINPPSKEHPILAAPRRAKGWKQYIDDHKPELEKLTPTGEGAVESSDYCESYVASLPNRPDSYSVVMINNATTVVAVEQPGFGSRQGNATFNGRNVPIRDWTDAKVMVELPSHTGGNLTIVKADSKIVPVSIH